MHIRPTHNILVKALLRVLYDKITARGVGSSGKYSIRQSRVLCLPWDPTLSAVFYRTARVYGAFTDLLVLRGRIIIVIPTWRTFNTVLLHRLRLLFKAPWCMFIYKYFKYLTWCFQLIRLFTSSIWRNGKNNEMLTGTLLNVKQPNSQTWCFWTSKIIV